MRSDGRLPEVETTLTIRPQPCSAISGAAARISRSGAAHVELPLPVPVLVGQLVERLDERGAGVVDEHVDPAEPLDAGGDDPLAGVGLRDVGGEDLGVARRRLGEPVAVAPDEQQPRALGGEQLGRRAADAPCSRRSRRSACRSVRGPCRLIRVARRRPHGVSAATSSAAGRTSPIRATVCPAYSGPARRVPQGRRRSPGGRQQPAARALRAGDARLDGGGIQRAPAPESAVERAQRARPARIAAQPALGRGVAARRDAAPASRGRTARSGASRPPSAAAGGSPAGRGSRRRAGSACRRRPRPRRPPAPPPRRRARRSRRRAAAGSSDPQRGAHPREQLVRRQRPAHVAARLDALHDHAVGARRRAPRAPPRPSRTGAATRPGVRRRGRPQK